jgi:spore coat polysaccharide biosynthesis protein SpsF
MESLKVLLITQARVGSTRFPNKVAQKLADTTLLGLHLERIKKSKNISHFCVATTEEVGVDSIIDISKKYDCDVFQGSLSDVLDRFYQAALPMKPEYVVRVTSDCPLLDSNLIDKIIEFTIEHHVDYCSNTLLEHFPDGQDVEVFKFSALEIAWKNAVLSSEREHVTPFIRNNSNFFGGTLFKALNFDSKTNYNHIRMTVDEPKDLVAIEHLVANLGKYQNWHEYTEFIINHISEFNNQDILRNEGYLKSLKTEH